MQQLAEAQGDRSISVIANEPTKSYQTCRNCGQHAWKPKEKCPAYGTTCNVCQKPNHWGKVRRAASRDLSSRRPKSHDRRRPRGRSFCRNGRQQRDQHSIVRQSTDGTDEQFTNMSFAEVKINSLDTHDEVYATLNIQLSSKIGIHNLKLKVETRVQGNTLPSCSYIPSGASRRHISGWVSQGRQLCTTAEHCPHCVQWYTNKTVRSHYHSMSVRSQLLDRH